MRNKRDKELFDIPLPNPTRFDGKNIEKYVETTAGKMVFGTDTANNEHFTLPLYPEVGIDTEHAQEIRPDYYGGVDNPYEVFKVVEAWGLDQDAYLFNVIKYVARCGKKTPNIKEDLKKALTYLQRRIDKLD